MKKNDGGPAFPRAYSEDTTGDWKVGIAAQQEGMSLRAWLAGQAMAAMMPSMMRQYHSETGLPITQNGSIAISPIRTKWIAEIAFKQADAVIEALERSEG